MTAVGVALPLPCRCLVFVDAGDAVGADVSVTDAGSIEPAICDIDVGSDAAVLNSDAILVANAEGVGATVTTLVIFVVVVDAP
jgi:hypothetical protein